LSKNEPRVLIKKISVIDYIVRLLSSKVDKKYSVFGNG